MATLPDYKPSSSFTVHKAEPLNAEPAPEKLIQNPDASWKTPLQYGYMRNHGEVLHLSKEDYLLSVNIEEKLRDSLDDRAVLSGKQLLDLRTILDVGRIDLAAALQVRGRELCAVQFVQLSSCSARVIDVQK